MKSQAITAVILRHLRLLRREPNRITMVLFWPLINIALFGFFGKWVQLQHEIPHFHLALLLGVCLWQAINTMAVETGLTLLEELWSHNIINLFACPLRPAEWLSGIVSFASLITVFDLMYYTFIVKLFYGIPMLTFGPYLLLFGASLIFSGIWIGMLILLLIIKFGKKAGELAFAVGWCLAPFTSAFYPREVLPTWAQTVGSFIPVTHILESMRSYILHNQNPIAGIILGISLSLVYIVITLKICNYMFIKTKEKGIIRLLD
ncbi:MAG TPA: ABC transporter permease [Candidatus Babeliaceae bacterium]|nr:ABC transporter permease [Candidatus Babeliaceae bacterium]